MLEIAGPLVVCNGSGIQTSSRGFFFTGPAKGTHLRAEKKAMSRTTEKEHVGPLLSGPMGLSTPYSPTCENVTLTPASPQGTKQARQMPLLGKSSKEKKHTCAKENHAPNYSDMFEASGPLALQNCHASRAGEAGGRQFQISRNLWLSFSFSFCSSFMLSSCCLPASIYPSISRSCFSFLHPTEPSFPFACTSVRLSILSVYPSMYLPPINLILFNLSINVTNHLQISI